MKITVLGPGSWGLTVTWMLTPIINNISLWGFPEIIDSIKANRNVITPVSVSIPESVHLTSSLEEAIQDTDLILLIVPSDAVRPVTHQLKKLNLSSNTVIVNLAKGFELSTLLRMSEVIKEELPNNPVATLSGPTLANEILAKKPTAAVIGCEDVEVSRFIQKTLHRDDLFRLYTNRDIAGVELGGSLKNVIAIATGFAHTLDLGHNAIGSIITRGLAEIVRISMAMGANPSTLYGLSGIGDLIATCSSPLSRNYKVGKALAEGYTLQDTLDNLGSVAEGVKTTKATLDLAKKYNVEMPISAEVNRLLGGTVSPKDAIKSIMKRELKSEDSYNLVR